MARTIIAAFIAVTLSAGCKGEFPTTGPQYRAAEVAYDSNRLTRSLQDIAAWHIEYGTGLANSLRAGTPIPSIDRAFVGEECTPSDELKALWAWRNGEHSSVPFVWYHDFLSMEEAKSEYKWLLLNPLVRWDPNYIPVFKFEGEWYASYCGHKTKVAGPVAHVFLEDNPRIAYTNITTFVSTMAEALRSGAVSWKNGAMVEDIRALYRIHQKHNRGYEFPYYLPKGN